LRKSNLKLKKEKDLEIEIDPKTVENIKCITEMVATLMKCEILVNECRPIIASYLMKVEAEGKLTNVPYATIKSISSYANTLNTNLETFIQNS
jgi:hypothetical protein